MNNTEAEDKNREIQGHSIKEKSRGTSEEDKRSFSQSAMEKLRRGQEEVTWLLNREYPMSTIINLVGGRYQFTSRQRNALQRATSSTEHCNARREKVLCNDKLCEAPIHIDGFNFIITMEVALSNGLLIRCQDGAIRDLAGLRGTYKLIDKTDKALKILGDIIKAKGIPEIYFYFDAPVSNSGRLKTRIFEEAENWDIPIHVDLVPNADVILEKKHRVVTSDAIILDKCDSWFNLAEIAVDSFIENTNIVDLSNRVLP